MFAVVQLNSLNDKSVNLINVQKYIESAAQKGAKMIFLPEAADYIATSTKETIEKGESIDDHFITQLQNLSSRFDIWISIGVHRKPANATETTKLFNSHVVINNKGIIESIYDKVHLFGIDLNQLKEDNKLTLNESNYIQAGNTTPVVVYNTPVGNLGLAICYDLRFPELSASLRYKGNANVLAFPSAFSIVTGEAGHWHTLLKARAIETQSYVIAAAQVGVHNSKFTTYGHSLVVNPWGQIIAELTDDSPGLLISTICHNNTDCSSISSRNSWKYCTDTVRNILPIAKDRRFDLFPLVDAGSSIPIGTTDFMFGPHIIKVQNVFFRTAVSMAFVNISPLVNGHVLVTPVTVFERFNDIPDGTVADMYATVKRISPVLLKHFGALCLTISVQDGVHAGQTVPHVHIHVLPRKPGDFSKNDDIYSALEQHDKVANRKYRSNEEMEIEANELRKYFYNVHGDPLLNT